MVLRKKVAIVTGGIRGIGRGITEELMSEGASVLAAYFETEEEADPALEELRAIATECGVRVQGYHVDISRISEIEEMFDFCEGTLGKVDIFIANAGANIPRKPILEHTEEDFDRVCGVNFKGTYFCVKECGKRMNDNGRIVLISSSSVPYPVDGHCLFYGASDYKEGGKAGNRTILYYCRSGIYFVWVFFVYGDVSDNALFCQRVCICV